MNEERKYSMNDIYLAFKKYKKSKGKKVTKESFKTSYLYKDLNEIKI